MATGKGRPRRKPWQIADLETTQAVLRGFLPTLATARGAAERARQSVERFERQHPEYKALLGELSSAIDDHTEIAGTAEPWIARLRELDEPAADAYEQNVKRLAGMGIDNRREAAQEVAQAE